MLKIDKEKCICCGSCPVMAPNTFKINEDEYKAEVIGDGSGDVAEIIQQAIDCCPTQAILKEE